MFSRHFVGQRDTEIHRFLSELKLNQASCIFTIWTPTWG